MKEKRLNYIPGSISFSAGFLGPRGNVGFQMVYDHNKAIEIIDQLKSDNRKITSKTVGLDGDFQENNSEINDAGELEYDFWQKSTWAEPILIVNFEDAPSETYSVWRKASPQPETK